MTRLPLLIATVLLSSLFQTVPAWSEPGGRGWLYSDFTAPQLVPLTAGEERQVWRDAKTARTEKIAYCYEWANRAKPVKCIRNAHRQYRRYVERNLQPLFWQGREHSAPIADIVYGEDGRPLNSPYVKFTPLWNECRSTISYSIDAQAAPAKQRVGRDVKQAFSRLSFYTGYGFNEAPADGDIEVIWDPALEDRLKGNASTEFAPDSYQTYHYDVVAGTVRINPRNDLSGERTKRWTGQYLRSELLFHELAHVMGLADTEDERSVMRTLTSFSRADLIGLKAVGRSRCAS